MVAAAGAVEPPARPKVQVRPTVTLGTHGAILRPRVITAKMLRACSRPSYSARSAGHV